jgi:hypothetical protein
MLTASYRLSTLRGIQDAERPCGVPTRERGNEKNL